jgi:hypothetical protein
LQIAKLIGVQLRRPSAPRPPPADPPDPVLQISRPNKATVRGASPVNLLRLDPINNALDKSRDTQEGDRKVAGIISGAAGIVLNKQQTPGNRRPIALVGKVYCKADAQYGRVEVGDLLTTSATERHAMKASDVTQAFGAVIGKALTAARLGTRLDPDPGSVAVGIRSGL